MFIVPCNRSKLNCKGIVNILASSDAVMNGEPKLTAKVSRCWIWIYPSELSPINLLFFMATFIIDWNHVKAGCHGRKTQTTCSSESSDTIGCLFAKLSFRSHSKTQAHALCATSGASDYAVKPNQFPVFGLMDAIIFMGLKQVSVCPYYSPPPHAPTRCSHACVVEEHTPRRYVSVK